MPTDQILSSEEMVGAGHATKSDTLNRFLNRATTAGDLWYATAAATAARLALGTANHRLFVNAGATAPEWAAGLKIGTFSIDTATATGTQAVSGVGFKPSHLIFLAAIAATAQVSIGFDDGTNHYALFDDHNTVAATFNVSASYSIYILQGAGITYTGAVSVLGADGFTVSWTKTGAKTGTATIYYLALR